MSTTSSTSSTTSAYSSKGLSGLISGLDTDTMVKKMLSGTQTKIDKQKQAKQVLQWKQTMYQSITSKINAFSSKYFDSAYDSKLSTNLSSSSFFNTMTSSVTSGSNVKIVSTGSTADTGEMTVLVSQLARAAKLTSSVQMSAAQTITGSAMDATAIASTLSSGKDLSFDMSFDGVSKTISFSSDDFSGDITADTIEQALAAKVKTAFGTYVGVSMTDNKLSFAVNVKDDSGNLESGHELKITGADASSFGITPGATSLLSTSSKLGSISGVEGSTYKFTINDKEFTFSSNDTVSTMMKKINASDAGVKIAYNSTTDKFTMTASSTGAQYGIDISQESGNLLGVLFGSDMVSAGTGASSALNTSSITGTALADDYSATSASMAFTVNGTNYTFSLATKSEGYTKSNIETELNSWLKTNFGETDGAANISYSDGKLSTAAGYSVSFSSTATDLGKTLGLAGKSNAVTSSTAVSDVAGFSGLNFLNSSGETASTLADIASAEINGTSYAVSFADGTLNLAGSGTLDLSGTGLDAFFGDSVTFGTGTLASSAVIAGQDAKFQLNGVETSRSSNTFTASGITMTLTAVSSEATVIGTERDTDTIVDAVKSFISDYNDMVSTFYGILTEKNEYSDYAPLTDEQENEMSESEITAWTEKAKTGLLRNDSTLSSFMQSMRSAFYTKVSSAGIAAYSIGIETTKDDKSGKLTLDETALRNALSSDPDAVAKLFTDSTNGLATKLSKISDNYAKLSVSSPGSFVQMAGASGWTANAKSNDIYEQLSKINDKLDDLQDKYDDEKERYWTKFSTMESVIAQYNSQSAMITSTFGSSS